MSKVLTIKKDHYSPGISVLYVEQTDHVHTLSKRISHSEILPEVCALMRAFFPDVAIENLVQKGPTHLVI